MNFADAFESAVEDFLGALENDHNLQRQALHRYREVKGEIEHTQKRTYGIGVAVTVGFAAVVTATIAAYRMR